MVSYILRLFADDIQQNDKALGTIVPGLHGRNFVGHYYPGKIERTQTVADMPGLGETIEEVR